MLTMKIFEMYVSFYINVFYGTIPKRKFKNILRSYK